MERQGLISILAIIIIGFAVYANSLGGEFVWDDDTLIRENVYIRHWPSLARIFTEDIGGGAASQSCYYRPLQILTYLIVYSFWKLNVFGYHLANILLHVMAALLLFRLVNILYKDTVLSFLTAAFFAAHPIHTEAVAYISGIADPLAAVFLLYCFICYVKQDYILMLASWVAALLSKESSMVLPGLLLVYHAAFREKFRAKEFFSLFGILLAYVWVRFSLLKYLLPEDVPAALTLERVPGFFVSITGYIRLLVLPLGLHMEYGKKIFSMAHPAAIAGIVILVSLVVFAFKNRKSGSVVFFSVGWFVISLLPYTNIYPALPAYMAEHYLYIASMGFFMLLAGGLSLLYKAKKARVAAIILALILLSFYSIAAARQNNYWKNPAAIDTRTLAYAPDSAKVHSDLGNFYNRQGRYKEAIESINKAIALDPKDANAYVNLGNSYYDSGDFEKAIELYKKAIGLEAEPVNVKIYGNLANSYAAIGNTGKAVSLLKKAIEINPGFAGSYYNLGAVYMKQGENEKAAEFFNKSLEIDPALKEAHLNLAVIYNNAGRRQEAVTQLKKALELDPAYEKARLNLSILER